MPIAAARTTTDSEPRARSDAIATRARIVRAAESLLAERGIDAVSLAEINKRAGQRNRSAVQYHFGSKQGVVHAILDKHTPGIEIRRDEMLDAVETMREDRRLRPLVEALVLPISKKLDDDDGGLAFVRLSAQLLGHRSYSLLDLHAQRPNRAADRLQQMISRACPSLPASLWAPRWLLLLGLVFHGLADYAELASGRRSEEALPSQEIFVANLIDSVVALLEVPASADTRSHI